MEVAEIRETQHLEELVLKYRPSRMRLSTQRDRYWCLWFQYLIARMCLVKH